MTAGQTTDRTDWTPAEGPLLSRFAGDLDPANPLPEYPRPHLRRDRWQNLNGLWDLKFAEKADDLSTPPADGFDERILVPFPIESALSGVGKRVHTGRVWYRRTFEIPADWTANGGRVRLNFGAVDWESHVYVNGKAVGTHKGGFDPFSFDITDALKPGENEVAVGVFDPSDGGTQPRGKQIRSPHGIWYTPVTGIWQTVWLEPVPKVSIESLKIVPETEAGMVEVTINAPGSPVNARARIEVLDADGQRVSVVDTDVAGTKRLAIADPHLWSPNDPYLYGLKVSLLEGEEAIDTVESYFALRSVSLGRREDGKVDSILLNGQRLFQVGPLDQGWWPDGLYTAPTDAALRYDIEITKELGFNMIRKHVKVEPARWYYWADKLGILVWQDMPSPIQSDSNMFVGPRQETDPELPQEVKEQFEAELREMIGDFGHHPSIIMWVVFNEGWGQHDVKRLTELTKQLDPSRLASNASGWADRGVGDVIDMHVYPGPDMFPLEENRVSVLGEFGGLGLPIEGHLWQADRNWGYRNLTGHEELTADYEELMRGVYKLRDSGLAAVVYTQTTDVEGEVNGLLTYDRAVIKVDPERIRRANLGQLELYDYQPLVPTADAGEAATWRYTTESPADGWMKSDFDASGWQEGKAGFGTEQTPGATVGTEWTTPGIWLRRTFTLEADDLNGPLALRIHHDEDATIYINGVQIGQFEGFTTQYILHPLDDEAKAALKTGQNLLAVHVRQTRGGQYIDVGLGHRTATANTNLREDAQAN